MTEKRNLAAILAADVVGFSRLTGSDEEGTLARLRTLWSDLIERGHDVPQRGAGHPTKRRPLVPEP
jgi:hypothetical protein